MPKFYKTIVTVTVLSELPLEQEVEEGSLLALHYAITDGNCVGTVSHGEPQELTGKEVADALTAAGSEPGFFRLDDDGKPTE